MQSKPIDSPHWKFAHRLGRLGRFAALLVVTVGLAQPAKADKEFADWLVEFWPKAAAAGITFSTFDRAFAGISPDNSVLERLGDQPESKFDIVRYIDGAASASRILEGQRQLVERVALLDRIEADFGVDRAIVLAIWGLETTFGDRTGDRSVIRSLSTFAYSGGRRAAYGETQLLAALEILQRGDVDGQAMTGSWAGAMGHTQFIPTTYNSFAVDYNGDGHRDIWTTVDDALASTANYLARSGWVRGLEWGFEVRLPEGFRNGAAAADKSVGKPRKLATWKKQGLARSDGSELPVSAAEAALWRPSGPAGPAFLVTRNFRTLLRYNNAVSYALAIGLLSEGIKGRPSPIAAWPRSSAEQAPPTE